MSSIRASQAVGFGFHAHMKNLMVMASTVIYALALTACGGGSSSDNSTPTPNRADEGIWSNHNNGPDSFYNWMQAVILSDGSYWGLVGQVTQAQTQNGAAYFTVSSILHGSANVNGSSVSGTYTGFRSGAPFNGAYSGTASARENIDLKFNDAFDPIISMEGGNFSLVYDEIYNQPAYLSAVAGSYLSASGGFSNGLYPPDNNSSYYYYINPNPTISGSSLILADGNVMMTGTITPHGTVVNVFDISLTTATAIPAYSMTGLFSNHDIPAGTVYKGILFQASSGGPENYMEIIATAGDSAYFYIGQKQN